MIIWSWPKNLNIEIFVENLLRQPQWTSKRLVHPMMVRLGALGACLGSGNASLGQGMPPRRVARLVHCQTDRLGVRLVLPWWWTSGDLPGHLDKALNGTWTPPRHVEGLVQIILGPKLSGLAFSHFVSCPKVRGITISPPWDHSSSNDTWLTWTWLKEDYHLTQHAKINSECNKLMQPLKPFWKHDTNIKITFKTMNAYAKLKLTLNMGFGYLGQEFYFLLRPY